MTLATTDPHARLDVLRDAVAAVTAASMACTRDGILDTAGDLEAAAQVLALARELHDRAGEVRASAERAMLVHLPSYGSVEVDGIGTITRRSASQRKRWDHPRISSMLLARTLDRLTNDDGEVRHGPGAVAQAVLDQVLGAAGIAYWRVGALKDLGINPDAVCEVEHGPDRVEFAPIDGGRP